MNYHDESFRNPLLSNLGLSPAHAGSKADVIKSPKKRRLKKSPEHTDEVHVRRCCRASWQEYVDGHIVSEAACKYIMNMLTATAAKVRDEQDVEQLDDTDEDIEQHEEAKGHLDIVNMALTGIAAHDLDEDP